LTESVLTDEQERDIAEFERYWDLLEGKVDIKNRLMILLNPDKPQTTAFLTNAQSHFVGLAHFMAQKFPVFKGLKDYADQVCLSSLGVEGKGIDASVRLSGAIVESKLLERLGIGISQKEKGK